MKISTRCDGYSEMLILCDSKFISQSDDNIYKMLKVPLIVNTWQSLIQNKYIYILNNSTIIQNNIYLTL